MSKLGGLGHRLYTGEVSFDFVGRRRYWFAMSGLVIIIGLVALFTRGLSMGIEFRGGSEFTIGNANHVTTQQARDAAASAGVTDATAIRQTTIDGNVSIEVETEPLDDTQTTKVENAFVNKLHVTKADIESQTVGASWGSQITDKAVKSLIVFILAIIVYLSIRYEWKLATGAIIALLHDLIITVGIYALVGFSVTPSTVIGFLTILGYSLYDTVVVFDKVRENSQGLAGGSRMTYSDAANLGVNQTLVRSINTSVVGLLPIASLLFVGAGLLGAGSLKDLALALFIGVTTGTYSSIFIATPIGAILKEREPAMRQLARRVAARQGRPARAPVTAAVAAGDGGGSGALTAGTERGRGTVLTRTGGGGAAGGGSSGDAADSARAAGDTATSGRRSGGATAGAGAAGGGATHGPVSAGGADSGGAPGGAPSSGAESGAESDDGSGEAAQPVAPRRQVQERRTNTRPNRKKKKKRR